MEKIFLESKNFNFKQRFSGYESNVFLYDDNNLIKIFKTNNNEILNNKYKKLEILSHLSTSDVLPTALIYIDGNFKGYKSVYRKNFYSINGFEQNKKIKNEILKDVLEKMNYYHSLNIYFGDIHQNNVLFNKETKEVILCDLDNFSINNLDFDKKNNYQELYLKFSTSKEKMDLFIFNLLTISYMQNISYPYVLDFLLDNGLKGILNTPENRNILTQMINLKDGFSGDLLINHTKRKILH